MDGRLRRRPAEGPCVSQVAAGCRLRRGDDGGARRRDPDVGDLVGGDLDLGRGGDLGGGRDRDRRDRDRCLGGVGLDVRAGLGADLCGIVDAGLCADLDVGLAANPNVDLSADRAATDPGVDVEADLDLDLEVGPAAVHGGPDRRGCPVGFWRATRPAPDAAAGAGRFGGRARRRNRCRRRPGNAMAMSISLQNRKPEGIFQCKLFSQ